MPITNIQKLRDKTYHEAMDKLDKYHKVAIISPTGFGKTGILVRIANQPQFKRVLYLYPTEVIVESVRDFYQGNVFPHIEFMSYHMVTKLNDDNIQNYENIDLIITDECHLIGAPQTSKGLHLLLDHNPDAYLVGATATPERMDLVDEINEFFDDIMVKRYTLHDAIKDGVLRKPFYCFASYTEDDLTAIQTQMQSEIKLLSGDQLTAQEKMLRDIAEIANIKRMPHVIRLTMDQCSADPQYNINTDYMKFIVYFSNFRHLHEKKNEVINWFQEAYPNYDVQSMIVTSETSEYEKNVHKLNSLQSTPNRIDLIFNCNMMTMGYHVDSLTGLILYRTTESGILFSQMVGRVFNSGCDSNGIIFDLVDNIHRESIYQVLGHKTTKTKKRMAFYTQMLEEIHHAGINPDTLNKLIIQEYYAGTRIPSVGMKTLMVLYSKQELHDFIDMHTILSNNSPKYNVNQIFQEDLLVTGWEATYRDIIAKTVAEPISMRCRQAYARWKEKGGDDSTWTQEAILSKVPPQYIPLKPFCIAKKVDVNRVLDIMGVPHELILRA